MAHKTHTVVLPDIGEGVVEGEVVQWLKEIGEEVGQDEPVVLVMTDKATVELPAPHPGVLEKRYVQEGEIAYKDAPLYDLQIEDTHQECGQEEKQLEQPVISSHVQDEKPSEIFEETRQVLASPAVRFFAKQAQIPLETVTPTGQNGQVTLEDVRAMLHVPREVTLDATYEKALTGVASKMVDTMAQSHSQVAPFTFFDTLDVSVLREKKHALAKEYAAQNGPRVTYMPWYIYALSKCLRAFPEANATLRPQEKTLLVHSHHHIGIAMDTPSGLLLPVLKRVESMTFQELVVAYEELKAKAFAGKLTPDDMKGSTISLTNFGALGGLAGTPVIPLPHVAILGLGAIRDRAVVIAGEIQVRPEQMLSWTFDHRVMDGSMAVRISSYFTQILLK